LLFVFAPAIAVAAGVFVATVGADIPQIMEKQVLGFCAAIEHIIIIIKTLSSI
jgi:hypothetical protein